MSLSSVTPTSGADTASTTSRTIDMPTVQDGDGAVLAIACAANLTPSLTPQGGWVNPFVAVRNIPLAGKCLHVYAATNLAASDSGKTLTIGTGTTSTKVCRGILPIRGASTVDIIDAVSSTKDGTTSSVNAATNPVTTVGPGCGVLDILMMRKNDGVSGDTDLWFTALDPVGGQGLTEDLDEFSATSSNPFSLSALCMAHDWTPRAAGTTVPGGSYVADKPGVHIGLRLSIRPGNVAPTVDAGPDIEVDAGDTAYVTAATATDADGSVASVSWDWIPGGEGVAWPPGVTEPTIEDDDTLTPSFVTDASGAYKLRVTATDDSGATSTDDVTVWAVTASPHLYEIVSAGGWEPFGTSDPIAALSDGSDSTGIRSSSAPSNDVCLARWEPMPAGAKTFEFDLANPVASPETSCTLTLLNRVSGTTIATRTETDLTDEKRSITWILTPTENGLVEDPHQIDLRVTANS